METKYVRVPFEVELAKKITNGEVEGKIWDTTYHCNVRVVDFNFQTNQGKLNLAISERGKGKEVFSAFNDEGVILLDRDGKFDNKPVFVLEIPEYKTFNDGDIVKLSNDTYVWLSIIKNIGFDKDFCRYFTEDYVSILINDGDLDPDFDSYSDAAEIAERTTEEEKQKLIDALKQSEDTRAKECLKKLGIEVKQGFEFKPFDKVLVRDADGVWFADIFSHYSNSSEFKYKTAGGGSWEQCIPYNEQTAHLLGTTENYE